MRFAPVDEDWSRSVLARRGTWRSARSTTPGCPIVPGTQDDSRCGVAPDLPRPPYGAGFGHRHVPSAATPTRRNAADLAARAWPIRRITPASVPPSRQRLRPVRWPAPARGRSTGPRVRRPMTSLPRSGRRPQTSTTTGLGVGMPAAASASGRASGVRPHEIAALSRPAFGSRSSLHPLVAAKPGSALPRLALILADQRSPVVESNRCDAAQHVWLGPVAATSTPAWRHVVIVGPHACLRRRSCRRFPLVVLGPNALQVCAGSST